MKSDLLMLRLNQMKHNMTAVFVHTLSIAEPLLAVVVEALDYCRDIMNATVSAVMRG